MALEYIFAIIFFVFLGILLFAEYRENLKLRYVCMISLMPLLLLYYFFGVSINEINWLIVIAVIFGYLGDIFLMFRKENFFILGLGAFLIGHIFYIIGFLISIENITLFPIWGILFVLPSIPIIFIVLKRTQDKLGDIKIPVFVYMGVIFTMSFCSILRLSDGISLSFLATWLGAILFILSDGMIALNKFDKPIPNGEVYIKLTYVLAQFFIVQGIMLAGIL